MNEDPFSLVGKRILVTGASSGIGRQIAITCAELGAHVVCIGRDSNRLASTLAELKGHGHNQIQANLAANAEVERIAAECGPVNGVVLAAGIAKLVPLRMIGKAHIEETFNINTYAPLLLTRAMLAKRRIVENGSIVFISSVASHIGPIASAAYAASKAALLGMMRTIGQEVAKHKIRANCIAPGYVRTPLLESLNQSGASIDELVTLAPLGLGEPEDVAHATAFFLSDASRWITRNHFVIDGGLTIPMDIYA
jgi:NAD(P)-dependent dehydrogenase (short-subunit alcohol dehydrogenase family)